MTDEQVTAALRDADFGGPASIGRVREDNPRRTIGPSKQRSMTAEAVQRGVDNVNYDGVLIGTAPPGFYSVEREKGPNAFQGNATAATSFVGCTARDVNKDCFKAGNPYSAPWNITVRRFVGHDSGRAFTSCVSTTSAVYEDYEAREVARSHINCEPDYPTATHPNGTSTTGVWLRRGQLRRVNFFAYASKGGTRQRVAAVLEDIRQVPGYKCGQVMWAHAEQPAAGAAPYKLVTFRRCEFYTSGKAWFPLVNATKSLADYIEKPLTDSSSVSNGEGAENGRINGDPSKAFFSINIGLLLENVWVNGRPVTEADVQWQYKGPDGQLRGIRPIIVHTPGWTPNMIAKPVGVSVSPIPDQTYGGVTPPPDPDPEPEPEPTDPCAPVRDELATVKADLVAARNQLATTQDALNVANGANYVLSVQKGELETSLSAARAELSAAQSDLAAVSGRVAALEGEVASANARLVAARSAAEQLVVALS